MTRKLLLAMLSVLWITSVAMAGGDLRSEIVQKLRQDGSDVSRPHRIDFYFYVRTESDARAVSRELLARGFSVETRRAADTSNWLCLARNTFVPDSDQASEIGSLFGALAKKYEGELDGWESEVLK